MSQKNKDKTRAKKKGRENKGRQKKQIEKGEKTIKH
jgi:hypothetical protein